MPEFSWRAANDATSEDVEAVFDAGGARKCRCQALKVPGWIWRDTTQDERDAALLEQAGCGTSGPTSGLVGYVDGAPAGWVAVEPREYYPRIWARQKAWMRMDPDLEGVWSVTCFLVRKGFRRQGLMYELAAATVEYGRQVGARVLEGYPTEPPPGKIVIWDEASVGLLQVFLDAGYQVEASPTLRRRVVRHRLGGTPQLARRSGPDIALMVISHGHDAAYDRGHLPSREGRSYAEVMTVRPTVRSGRRAMDRSAARCRSPRRPRLGPRCPTTVEDWCEQWLVAYGTHKASTVRQARTHVAQIKAESGPMALVDVKAIGGEGMDGSARQ
ncbi:hypothetical protein GCM10023168_20800 [Fodinibacter luteus]|uniref:N-acetyltransferase domain-containing protein n=1 Tax=Fodinibacter luteus TaxID=552064 RepID=A0ABP8KGW9_9MICO